MYYVNIKSLVKHCAIPSTHPFRKQPALSCQERCWKVSRCQVIKRYPFQDQKGEGLRSLNVCFIEGCYIYLSHFNYSNTSSESTFSRLPLIKNIQPASLRWLLFCYFNLVPELEPGPHAHFHFVLKVVNTPTDAI